MDCDNISLRATQGGINACKVQALLACYTNRLTTSERDSSCMQGVSAEFDEAEGILDGIDAELQSHLEQVKSQLKSNRSICYVSLNKDSHVLEIPEVKMHNTTNCHMLSITTSCPHTRFILKCRDLTQGLQICCLLHQLTLPAHNTFE